MSNILAFSHPSSLARRLIALLLVPCLVADPGANALIHVDAWRATLDRQGSINISRFQEEALAARLEEAFHNPLDRLAAWLVRLQPRLQPAEGLLERLGNNDRRKPKSFSWETHRPPRSVKDRPMALMFAKDVGASGGSGSSPLRTDREAHQQWVREALRQSAARIEAGKDEFMRIVAERIGEREARRTALGGLGEIAREITARLRRPLPFTPEELGEIRARFAQKTNTMGEAIGSAGSLAVLRGRYRDQADLKRAAAVLRLGWAVALLWRVRERLLTAGVSRSDAPAYQQTAATLEQLLKALRTQLDIEPMSVAVIQDAQTAITQVVQRLYGTRLIGSVRRDLDTAKEIILQLLQRLRPVEAEVTSEVPREAAGPKTVIPEPAAAPPAATPTAGYGIDQLLQDLRAYNQMALQHPDRLPLMIVWSVGGTRLVQVDLLPVILIEAGPSETGRNILQALLDPSRTVIPKPLREHVTRFIKEKGDVEISDEEVRDTLHAYNQHLRPSISLEALATFRRHDQPSLAIHTNRQCLLVAVGSLASPLSVLEALAQSHQVPQVVRNSFRKLAAHRSMAPASQPRQPAGPGRSGRKPPPGAKSRRAGFPGERVAGMRHAITGQAAGGSAARANTGVVITNEPAPAGLRLHGQQGPGAPEGPKGGASRPPSDQLAELREPAARVVKAVTRVVNDVEAMLSAGLQLWDASPGGLRLVEARMQTRQVLERIHRELPLHLEAAREEVQRFRLAIKNADPQQIGQADRINGALSRVDDVIRRGTRFATWLGGSVVIPITTMEWWETVFKVMGGPAECANLVMELVGAAQRVLLNGLDALERVAVLPRHRVLMSLDDTRQPKPEEEAARAHLYARQLEAFIAIADELSASLQAAAAALRDAGARDDHDRVNKLTADIRRLKEEAAAAVELDDLELLTELWEAVIRRAAADALTTPGEPLSLLDRLRGLLEHLWRIRSIFEVSAAQEPLEAIEQRLAQASDAAPTTAQTDSVRKDRKGTLLEGLRDFLHPFGSASGDPWWGWASEYLNLIRGNRGHASKAIAQNELRGLRQIGILDRTTYHPGNPDYYCWVAPWLEGAWAHARDAVESFVFPKDQAGAALLKPLAIWRLQTQAQRQAAEAIVRRLRLIALKRIMEKAGLPTDEMIHRIQRRDDAEQFIQDLGLISARSSLPQFKKMVETIIQSPNRMKVTEVFEQAVREGRFGRTLLQVWKDNHFLGTAFVVGHRQGYFVLMTAAHVASEFNQNQKIPLVSSESTPRPVGDAVCVLQGKPEAFSDTDVAWLLLPDDGDKNKLKPLGCLWDPSQRPGGVVTHVSVHPKKIDVQSGYAPLPGEFESIFCIDFVSGDSGSPLLIERDHAFYASALWVARFGPHYVAIPLQRTLLEKAISSFNSSPEKGFKRTTADSTMLDVLNQYLSGEMAATKQSAPPAAASEKAPTHAHVFLPLFMLGGWSAQGGFSPPAHPVLLLFALLAAGYIIPWISKHLKRSWRDYSRLLLGAA